MNEDVNQDVNQDVINNLTVQDQVTGPAPGDGEKVVEGAKDDSAAELERMRVELAQLKQRESTFSRVKGDLERLFLDADLNDTQQEGLARSVMGGMGFRPEQIDAFIQANFGGNDEDDFEGDDEDMSSQEIAELRRKMERQEQEEVRRNVDLIRKEIRQNITNAMNSDTYYKSLLDKASKRGDNSVKALKERLSTIADQETIRILRDKSADTGEDVTVGWVEEAAQQGWKAAVDLARTFDVAPVTPGQSGSLEDPFRAILDKEPVEAPEPGTKDFKEKSVERAVDKTLRSLLEGKQEL
jgi:hypothetical protein